MKSFKISIPNVELGRAFVGYNNTILARSLEPIDQHGEADEARQLLA
jgi:hypothetical protein